MNRRITALAAMLLTVAMFALLVGNFCKMPYNALAQSEQKIIYLTFDDGPSDRVTPKILDVLKNENVPATFFIVGTQAKTRKDILKRAYKEGHTIAIHSNSHKYAEIYASPSALLEDIQACNNLICSVTGENSSLYRFPGGSFSVSQALIKAVSDKGYKYVDWNASFRDSELKQASSEELFRSAVATAGKQSKIIMLAHDSTDKYATIDALKMVIKHFKAEGFSFKKFI